METRTPRRAPEAAKPIDEGGADTAGAGVVNAGRIAAPARFALSSMTGFARVEGDHGALHWAWEAKSVNGRGFDMRVRVPNGFEGLEAEARKRASARFKRGTLHATLQVTRQAGAGALSVNEAALAQVLAAAERMRAALPEAPTPTIEGLLGLRGVLDVQDQEDIEPDREARQAALLTGFEGMLDAMAAARAGEGAAIGQVLWDQVARIETLIEEAQACAMLQPDRLRERMKAQVALLLQDASISEDRLYQELAILLTKADVTEELDRLRAHTRAAQDLLSSPEPIGRRFDFLTQEFNREANTLCSKSSDMALTRIGLDLKVVIDQMREQVQNVE